MHKKVVITFLLALLLAGCGRASNNSGAIDNPQQSPGIHSEVDDYTVTLLVQGIDLRMPRPSGWEYYETEYGIVLAEEIGSVADDGLLNGLLTHVFIHPLEEFSSLPALNTANLARDLMEAIIDNPAYIGEAQAIEPVAFVWNDLDAAYYLMKNSDSTVTVVIGVVAPQSNKLVATSISAPVQQAERLRDQIPLLLDGMRINGVQLNGGDLSMLPNPLEFPST